MIINASPNFVVPNDTNLHTAYSLTIPGGTLGASGGLRLTACWSSAAAAGTHITSFLFGSLQFGSAGITATITSVEAMSRVANAGSETSQIAFLTPNAQTYPGSSANPVSTAAIDTTQDVVLSITAQKVSAARALTLLTVVVEIFGNRSSL